MPSAAYGHGDDSLGFFPSENSIAVSRTLRGGTILPPNVVDVRPEPAVPGYTRAATSAARHTAGPGAATVGLEVLDSKQVPDGKTMLLRFYTDNPRKVHAVRYELADSATGQAVYSFGTDFHGEGRGPVGLGVLAVINTPDVPYADSATSGFTAGSGSNMHFLTTNKDIDSIDIRRPGYPAPFTITFSKSVLDTSLLSIVSDAVPVKFRITAETPAGPVRLPFYFHDANGDSTMSAFGDFIDIVTTIPGTAARRVTWRVIVDTTGQVSRGRIVPPTDGDTYRASIQIPVSNDDVYSFTLNGESVSPALARQQYRGGPYVVPNPYAGAASFEPERFAVSGRGERRMEFRNIPVGGTIRIYTVSGYLVQTLHQDGSTTAMVAWDLRTKDNLDVAPGLYIFHVEAPGLDAFIGKFAIIK